MRFRSHGARLSPLAGCRPGAFPPRGCGSPPDRYPRLSRFHRPRPAGAGGGGNRAGGGQRAERHRADHPPHDGLGRRAQAVPDAGGEQDRRRAGRPARLAGQPARGVRQGSAADQPAGRRRQQGCGLFLQSGRRVGFFVCGGGAPGAGRPGGGGRRGADGALSGARGNPPGGVARALRAGAARRAPDSAVLRFRA
ncbi:hypothetical protein D9M70_434140 [compost metagenome]